MSQDNDVTLALQRKEKEWEAMIRIAHDFFLNWRRAVAEQYGDEAAAATELRAWELVADGTAKAFLARSKPEELEKFVASIARVSGVMGETAHVEKSGDDVLLVHTGCPWPKSYQNYGVGTTCQAGCDHWFSTSATQVSPRIKVVTESAMPAGGATCTRRFSWTAA